MSKRQTKFEALLQHRLSNIKLEISEVMDMIERGAKNEAVFEDCMGTLYMTEKEAKVGNQFIYEHNL